MIEQLENRKDYFRIAIFIVILFFSIIAFSESSKAPIGRAYQIGFTSELHPTISALNDAQQFFGQGKLLPIVDQTNCKYFDDNLKLIVDNRLINQRIVS